MLFRSLHLGRWWYPLGAGGAGGRGFWCPAVCVPSLSPCLLSAFMPCPWWVMLEYGSISRFKGVFSAVYGVRVGLCCLGALRGLCGFCVREWLGGYKTCGVFASLFILFCPLSCPFAPVFASFYTRCPSLLWLSFFVLLHCLCCFFFPFGCIDKKKGRKSLRPLLSCCGIVYRS